MAIVSTITIGVYSAFAPFQVIYDFGNRFRAQQEINQDLMEVRYEIVNTNTKIGGRKINVEVTKGPTDYYTVVAIWMEDTAGNYIETLYATKNIDNDQSSYLMKVIGHGHHSGADGKLYPDLSNITTAFDITERVLVVK